MCNIKREQATATYGMQIWCINKVEQLNNETEYFVCSAMDFQGLHSLHSIYRECVADHIRHSTHPSVVCPFMGEYNCSAQILPREVKAVS